MLMFFAFSFACSQLLRVSPPVVVVEVELAARLEVGEGGAEETGTIKYFFKSSAVSLMVEL